MKYRREIDGLRALAVLPVIFFHAGFKSFAGGFVGVDIFFVISGYLITSIILLEKEQGTFSLVKFYERRARRILPVLLLVTVACLPFAWLWLLPSDMADFCRSLVAVSAFSSNILFWREVGYFDVAAELKPMLHTWSLAIEEQYYLVFPLFLGLVWKFRKPWILGSLVAIGLVSLGLAQWGAYNRPAATFFLLPTRAWELMIGACLAFRELYWPHHAELLTKSKPIAEAAGLTGLFLIVYAVFAFGKTTPSPSAYILVPTIGTALIILFATQETIAGRLLGGTVFVSVGLISYSAYIWHQPVFSFARHISLTEPDGSIMILLSLATLAVAYVSWRYVERPFRRADLVGRTGLFVPVSVVTVGLLIFGLWGHINNGFAERPHMEAIKSFIEVVARNHGQNASWEKLGANPSITGGTRIGSAAGLPEFGIVGDSHAASLVRSLDYAALREGMSGVAYTFNGCPAIRDSRTIRPDHLEVICDAFRHDFFTKLESDNIPPIVIVASRWTILIEQTSFDNEEGGIERGSGAHWTSQYTDEIGYRKAIKNDIINSIRLILNSGRKVILVYPVPEMGWNVPVLLAKLKMRNGSLNGADASVGYDVFKQRSSDTNHTLDEIQNNNLYRIKPENIFCNSFLKDRCAAHVNGMPFYFDDNHLSELGADLVINQIIGELKSITRTQ